VAAIAMLFQLLHSAMPRAYFAMWSRAWTYMAGALLALRLSFAYPALLWPFEALYYLGEYGFAVLLAQGFRCYPDLEAGEMRIPTKLWLVLAGVSVFLTCLPVTFAQRFGMHAIVLSGLLLVALWHLNQVRWTQSHSRMKAFAASGLALLPLNFGASGLTVGLLSAFGKEYAESYVAYQSIVDLVVEQILAFGLIAIATLDMRTTLESARTAMQAERDRMAMLANQDSLTGCFNRLALDHLKQGLGSRVGCLAMVDLNYLKTLNDEHGHAVGDLAICQVANALKQALRSGDHVFRTGGDEFVLVCFDLESIRMLERLHKTQEHLNGVVLHSGHLNGLAIAYGVCEFNGAVDFDRSLEKADVAMYAHKSSGRTKTPR